MKTEGGAIRENVAVVLVRRNGKAELMHFPLIFNAGVLVYCLEIN